MCNDAEHHTVYEGVEIAPEGPKVQYTLHIIYIYRLTCEIQFRRSFIYINAFDTSDMLCYPFEIWTLLLETFPFTLQSAQCNFVF